MLLTVGICATGVSDVGSVSAARIDFLLTLSTFLGSSLATSTFLGSSLATAGLAACASVNIIPCGFSLDPTGASFVNGSFCPSIHALRLFSNRITGSLRCDNVPAASELSLFAL